MTCGIATARRPGVGLSRLLRPSLLALVVIALAGCGLAPDPDPSVAPHPDPDRLTTLAGTSWTLLSVNDLAVGLDPPPRLKATAKALILDGACNELSTAYRFDPATGALAVEGGGTTLVGCSGQAEAIDDAAFRALDQLAFASIDAKGRLVLSGPGGKLVLLPSIP
jgi:hypothetical protein